LESCPMKTHKAFRGSAFQLREPDQAFFRINFIPP
jgi:hypothetical protein